MEYSTFAAVPKQLLNTMYPTGPTVYPTGLPVSDDLMRDLMSRKEFAYLFSEQGAESSGRIQLLRNQLFAINLARQNTPYSRILVKHGTGTGKTITGLLIAKSFLDKGKKVMILGQNKQQFYNDAATKPSLGFVDKETSEAYKTLVMEQVKFRLPAKEFRRRLKILLKNKINFSMMGYKKFTNRVLGQYYGNGAAEVDIEFIKEFDGGAIIVDEVHNVYNSEERNQWGDVLLFMSLFLQRNIKLILMSGTPVNNSLEIYDLANLLYDENLKFIPNLEQYIADESVKLNKNSDDYIKNLFRRSLFPDRDIPLTTELLTKAFRNKVSFFPSGLGATDIPRLIPTGEPVVPGSQLMVTVVEPSEHEARALRDGIKRGDIRDIQFFDFCYYPRNEPVYALKSTQRELDGSGIELFKTDRGDRTFLSGVALMESGLKKYSGKMAHLLKVLQNTTGKVLIYHHDVSGTGILTIAEMLKQNGILTENGQQMPDSICYKCGRRVALHSADGDHVPKVTRFAMLYGEQNKDISLRVLNSFNSQENIDGSQLRIIIGSRQVKEGVDFKELRHLFVMQQPYNIPQLQQIIGRGVRQGSHSRLMEKERTVTVHILCSPLHEREDYLPKIMDFNDVVKYDKLINSIALDSQIHFVTAEERATGDIKQKTVDVPALGIGSVSYDIAVLQRPDQVDSYTYNAFQHYKQEISTISYILSVAFERSIVWDYQQLKQFVWSYPATPNPQFFSEHNLLMTIKRHQYQVVDGLVIPQIATDVDSLFVSGKPKLQTFFVKEYDVLSQQAVSDVMRELRDVPVTDDAWPLYLGILRHFYNTLKVKDLHQRLIQFMIKKKQFSELLHIYGSFIYFVGERGQRIPFRGVGTVAEHNSQFADIHGYHLNDLIYIYRKHNWETTSFNEYAVPKVKDRVARSQVIGFQSWNMDFRIYYPSDALDGQQIDKRMLKRGKLCNSNSRQRNKLFKQLQQIISKTFGDVAFDRLFEESQRDKKREFSCETIQLMMMYLQVFKHRLEGELESLNWFFLLDDIVDADQRRDKKRGGGSFAAMITGDQSDAESDDQSDAENDAEQRYSGGNGQSHPSDSDDDYEECGR